MESMHLCAIFLRTFVVISVKNFLLLVYRLATQIFDFLESELPAEFNKKYGLSWNLLKASIGDERGRTKFSEV